MRQGGVSRVEERVGRARAGQARVQVQGLWFRVQSSQKSYPYNDNLKSQAERIQPPEGSDKTSSSSGVGSPPHHSDREVGCLPTAFAVAKVDLGTSRQGSKRKCGGKKGGGWTANR